MKSCKIFAINGSHRSEKGFTEIVLKNFLQGAEAADAQYSVLYPSKQKIIACESCGKCLFETPGECKFDDDMGKIIQKMDEADLLVFACPVYFDSMPSNMKKMIERMRSTLDAYFEFRNGRTYHLKSNEKKQNVVLIFTAGNPEEESFASISKIFNRIIDNMGWQLDGEFHFPASHLLVAEPELLADQLEAVRMCGTEIVSQGKIPRALLETANREYINDPEATLRQMTQTILKIREDRRHGAARGESCTTK